MKKLSWILVFAFGLFSCDLGLDTQDEMTLLNENSGDLMTTQLSYGVPQSDNGIYPYENNDGNGGNTSCEDAVSILGIEPFEFTSGRMNYGEESFNTTVGPITITVTDNKFVSWSSTVPVKAVFIVKGGSASNLYYYADCTSGDSGLGSPVNASSQVADLSNLTICYSLCETEEKCYEDETAWGAGARYVTKGNWATYTAYSGSEKEVTLFAGQTMNAGTVEFSNAMGGNVTITINLNAGWKFDDTDAETENVHIMPYSSMPTATNPAPGQFLYTEKGEGSSFSITVPYSSSIKFFGIHTAVLREVECPVTE